MNQRPGKPGKPTICLACGGEAENGTCISCLLSVGIGEGIAETSALDFDDIPEGDWRLGGYELLEEIGRGGMGVIYRARQPFSNRLVAVKRLLPHHGASPETALRLRREAEAVASLDHPHILPIYEVGSGEDGLPFFSMKLAAGGSLAENGARLRGDARAIAELMVKIARAVQYAHSRGILHRDLKPGNILLDGNGEPLVADFGLAKWLDRPSDLTQSLTTFGTPGFLAPEQAAGPASQLGPAADIYSLGAIFFDLLAARPPFVGENAWAVVQQAAQEKAPALRALLPTADRDLETICIRCLEREPSARYKNAGDLADDLQRWLDGRPILARPVSWPETGWRWIRRNRLLAAVGCFCVVVTVLGLLRWSESRRLASLVEEQKQAALAVRLLPIFDMDAVSSHSPDADAATGAISQAISSAGRILKTPTDSAPWSRDFVAEAKSANAPYLIAGVMRQTAEGKRFALHWFDAREGRFTRRVIGVAEDDPFPLLRRLTGELLAGRGSVLPEENPKFTASSLEARDLIAAGEQYYARATVESLDQAILCGEKAIKADPQSVRAHSMLALALAVRAWYGAENQAEFQNRADVVIKKATDLAPESSSVYLAKATIAFYAGRLEEGRDGLRIYLERSMDVAGAAIKSGNIAKLYGRSDQALAWFRLASPFPRRQNTLTLEADVLADLEMDAEAEAAYQKFADLFPDRPEGRMGLCEMKLLKDQFNDARGMIESLSRDFPTEIYPKLLAGQEAFYARDFPRAAQLYGKLLETDRKGGAFFYGSISFLSGKGFSLLAMGRKAEGLLLLEEARRNDLDMLRKEGSQSDHLNSLAATEAALGNRDAALKLLRENLDVISTSHRFIERDPRFDLLRSDSRFKEFLAAMNTRMVLLKRQVAAENALLTDLK